MKTREPAVRVDCLDDARVRLTIGDQSRELHYAQACTVAEDVQAMAEKARHGHLDGRELRAARNRTNARYYPGRDSVRLRMGPYFIDLPADMARRVADELHDAADALDQAQEGQDRPQ